MAAAAWRHLRGLGVEGRQHADVGAHLPAREDEAIGQREGRGVAHLEGVLHRLALRGHTLVRSTVHAGCRCVLQAKVPHSSRR